MRELLCVVFLVLMAGNASAQPVYTLQNMMRLGFAQCVQQRGPQAQAFCSCYVRRWVGLWDANDSYIWRRTGQATPHMREMESVAMAQCSQ